MAGLHAYLIMAHNNFKQLERLIHALDYSENEIFVHVDVRAAAFDRRHFEKICKYSRIHIYQEIAVKWGRYEQIEVEMLLFEKASQHGPFTFYHLISGSDLPLKSQPQIHDFFNQYIGENFVDIRPISDGTPEIRRRARFFHFFVGKGWKNQLLHRICLVPQLLLGINRLKGKDVSLYFGSNWCSLTHEFVLYLIKQKDFCAEMFHHVNSCDELFVQTIIKRGEFRLHSTVHNEASSISRYIDWSGGGASPKTLDVSDLDKIIASDACFARKFDADYDAELVSQILRMIGAE